MDETKGQKVIRFIEAFCVVPEGDLVGKPVKLDKFQKKFILAVYDNKYITDTAILSMARKNAKTGLIAFLVIVHLVSHLAILNSRIISGAMSREQAAEVFNLASKCVALSDGLRDLIRIVPSSKKMIGLSMNVEYQAISAEGKTAHGKSPVVAILDEVGQIKGATNDFVSAIETSQGAYNNALLIYISTQASTDADYFSLIIDDALKNKPKKTVCHVYAAKEECDIMDKRQWRAANPALGSFRSRNDMQKQAEKAQRMPSFENTFRNLNLNQRVETNNPFINVGEWKACRVSKKAMPKLKDCEKVFGGFDLSNKLDLTAFILIGLYEGEWYIYPYFWTPKKGLRDRARRDKAPYDLWVKQGYINATPSATIDYGFAAQETLEIVKDVNLISLGFDRWRLDFFQREVELLDGDLPIVPFGQGFKDMSPAVECLEGKIMERTIHHCNNPVLNMCMANSSVIKNPAGDRKLDKMKATGRIDGAVALVQACGVSEKPHDDNDLDDFFNNPIVI